MTILKNAGSLKEQLLALGFPAGLEQELLFQLCFLPGSFTMRTRMEFGSDSVLFALQFERSEPEGEYRCLYFDAILRKQVNVDEFTDAGSKELIRLMDAVPWSAIGQSETIPLELAQDIEKAVTGLGKTEAKFMADTLRYKYWRDTVFEERINVPPGIRSRFEVRQHFYSFDGEARITAKDAYLFLNNKWLEKQMQTKRKNGLVDEVADANTGTDVAPGKRGRKKVK